MSRRRVRQDELELWQRVARTTQRLHAERKAAVPAKLAGAPEKPAPGDGPPRETPGRFALGERANGVAPAHDVLTGLRERVATAPLQMDSRTFGKLKRGKLRPEAKLDLHGMTTEQAHPALTRFILGAQASGKRLVLVVTGKGKPRDEGGPIPTRLGVLRHNVPHWLAQPPLAQAVLQISEAHLRHGGGGAYYVYLRRNR